MTDKINEQLTTKDSAGRVATSSMFKQYNKRGTECIEDWRERFVATLDPTEYAGAIELVGSWSAWTRLKKNWPSFQKLHLDDWLDEIEVRMKSLAMRSLIMEAQKEVGSGNAAKFIAEGKYKEKRAGRPTKAEVARRTKIDSELDSRIKADLERIGIK